MAEGNPGKKAWLRPQLLILTRESETKVLDFCKSGQGLSVPPHGPGWGGCMYARGWSPCPEDCCLGDYVISQNSPCAPSRYRGCYCGCYVTQAS
jgi:hypothetical protein